MGKPVPSDRYILDVCPDCKPREVKHLSTSRNRNQHDISVFAQFVAQGPGYWNSPNSGERKGNSPNRIEQSMRGCKATMFHFMEGELQMALIKESAGKRSPRG